MEENLLPVYQYSVILWMVWLDRATRFRLTFNNKIGQKRAGERAKVSGKRKQEEKNRRKGIMGEKHVKRMLLPYAFMNFIPARWKTQAHIAYCTSQPEIPPPPAFAHGWINFAGKKGESQRSCCISKAFHYKLSATVDYMLPREPEKPTHSAQSSRNPPAFLHIPPMLRVSAL